MSDGSASWVLAVSLLPTFLVNLVQLTAKVKPAQPSVSARRRLRISPSSRSLGSGGIAV